MTAKVPMLWPMISLVTGKQNPEHAANWATWTFIWDEAVQRQAERILGGEFESAQVDAILFASALRNVLRGAQKVLGRGSAAVQTFNADVPDAVHVRDILEHFDEYVTGKGKLQREGRMEAKHWVPLHASVSGHSHSVIFGPFRLEVAGARHASSELSAAAQDMAEKLRTDS